MNPTAMLCLIIIIFVVDVTEMSLTQPKKIRTDNHGIHHKTNESILQVYVN